MKKNSGFTLIEVLIAMTILAFLTVSVVQTIRRGVDFKKKIQSNIDERTTLSSAMRMIERDINLAFHYQDISKEVLTQLKQSGVPKPGGTGTPGSTDGSGDQGGAGRPVGTPPSGTPSTNPYQDIKVRDIPNYTAFIGDKNSLHFTNLNNISSQGDQNYGDQEEVGYFVKSCKSLDGKNTSDCLWRRSSPIVDDDVTKGGNETVLLEGVKRFELRYFGKEKEDWVDHWHSDGKEDAALKNKFPQAVEVTITLEKNKKETSAIRVIPLRFPNNQEPRGDPQQGTGQKP